MHVINLVPRITKIMIMSALGAQLAVSEWFGRDDGSRGVLSSGVRHLVTLFLPMPWHSFGWDTAKMTTTMGPLSDRRTNLYTEFLGNRGSGSASQVEIVGGQPRCAPRLPKDFENFEPPYTVPLLGRVAAVAAQVAACHYTDPTVEILSFVDSLLAYTAVHPYHNNWQSRTTKRRPTAEKVETSRSGTLKPPY